MPLRSNLIPVLLGGRFFQGKGIRPFSLQRKEEGGKIVTYTNKTANDKLGELESQALEILKQYSEKHISWSLEQFRTDFENAPRREMFHSYAKGVIEQVYMAREQFKRAKIANDALSSFEAYDADFPKKMFQDVNIKYLQGYEDYAKKKGNTPNTISIRLREIRRFFNLAIRDKVITQDLYPFSSGKEDGKVRIPQPELSRTDQYLTLDSMKILAGASFKNAVLERTRHLFLFSYYCRGMNWKDMAQLTSDNFYRATVTDETTKESKEVVMLQYRRAKTNGEFDIQITPNIQRELDWFKENTPLYGDYVLPIISQALGHQSVETTKHYLAKFSTTKMAEETDIDLMN